MKTKKTAPAAQPDPVVAQMTSIVEVNTNRLKEIASAKAVLSQEESAILETNARYSEALRAMQGTPKTTATVAPAAKKTAPKAKAATEKKIDGRSKEARALKAAGKTPKAAKPAKAPKATKAAKPAKSTKAAKPATTEKKIDGRSKEARALKAKNAGKAVPTTEKKIDGRSKEARALKAAGKTPKTKTTKAAKPAKAPKAAKPAPAAATEKKIDGRSKEARALKAAGATPKAPKAAKPAPVKSAPAGTKNPPIKEAIKIVLTESDKPMGAGDILAALNAKGWTPGGDKPQTYISTTLSANKDLFAKEARGLYRLAAAAVSTPSVPAPTTASKKAPPAVTKSDEQELAELGVSNIESNPFEAKTAASSTAS